MKIKSLKIYNCIKNLKIFNIIIKQTYKNGIFYLDNLKIRNNHVKNAVQNHPRTRKLYILKNTYHFSVK